MPIKFEGLLLIRNLVLIKAKKTYVPQQNDCDQCCGDECENRKPVLYPEFFDRLFRPLPVLILLPLLISISFIALTPKATRLTAR